jgi:hypothetical protein
MKIGRTHASNTKLILVTNQIPGLKYIPSGHNPPFIELLHINISLFPGMKLDSISAKDFGCDFIFESDKTAHLGNVVDMVLDCKPVFILEVDAGLGVIRLG